VILQVVHDKSFLRKADWLEFCFNRGNYVAPVTTSISFTGKI